MTQKTISDNDTPLTTWDVVNALKHMGDDHECCRYSVEMAIAHIADLEQQLAGARRDKERLDFVLALRSSADSYLPDGTPVGLCHYSRCRFEDRGQIDAAMKEDA